MIILYLRSNSVFFPFRKYSLPPKSFTPNTQRWLPYYLEKTIKVLQECLMLYSRVCNRGVDAYWILFTLLGTTALEHLFCFLVLNDFFSSETYIVACILRKQSQWCSLWSSELLYWYCLHIQKQFFILFYLHTDIPRVRFWICYFIIWCLRQII